MATTKKSSQSNKTSSKRKSTKRKSPVKKGKVYIAPYKIIVLCAGIIIVCMALLLATSIASSPKSKDANHKTISERFEQIEKKTSAVAKNTESKTEKTSEKPKTQEKVKEDAPAESKKSVSKPAEKVQVPAKPVAPDPTPTPEPAKVEPKKTTPAAKQPEKPVEKKIPQEKPTVPANPAKPAVPVTPPEPVKKTPETKKDYGFPQAKNGAQLIFVFDDGGQNLSHLENFLKLPFPITVAILPQLAYSSESAEKVRKSGNEVILHQPMQSVNSKVNPGPGAITPQMSEEQIKSLLFQNINQIAPISGLNNHEGSAITADAEKMAVILQYATEQGIYFLDSRTNVETKVPYVAGEMGYSYYERNIFLDNEKTRENVMKELNKGLALANKNGSVIMIGHVWSADFLPQLLQEIYPELKAKGYTFSVVSKSKAKK